jgi:polyhydroxyalkanoate synthesis repressor PhaR
MSEKKHKKMSNSFSDDQQARIDETIIIKKYANRRLYNMAESHYITLEDLAGLIKNGRNFIVYDAKTGDDITRSILTQIIAEQEAKGHHLLPISFLRDMIRFYGDKVTGFVPDYWENTMQIFKDNHEKIQKNFDVVLWNPFEQIKKVTDNHTNLLQKAAHIFNPFYGSQHVSENKETITLTKKDYEQLIEMITKLTHEIKTLKQEKDT